jgi:phage terminase large subunit GpA-like protein
MPARYLFLDEVDAYEGDVDGEGDPISLAEARTRTFGHRRKVFMTSTPTIKGLSRIEREYEASDRRRYFLPCPHCNEKQWLKFERLRWEKGKPETAAYHCESCEEPIPEHHKTWMLENGEWRPTAESTDPHLIGFHISSLYSPVGWLSWALVAREGEAAQGNDSALKTFKNTVLGETWQEQGEAPDWERLSDKREKFVAPVPDGALFLTAGVDVQGNRIEADIWAWGRGLESWLVDHIVIEGGPATQEAWEGLDELLSQAWTHQSGLEMKLSRLCIDTGYETSAVYAWARRAGFGIVSPVKGVEGFNRSSPVSGPTFVDATIRGKKLSRGARLWTVAVSTFKSETYRFLNLKRPTNEDREVGEVDPAGTIHLPQWADSEWIRQLVAEQLTVVKTRRGFQKLEWQKMRERNEALDCRVYARAAAWILGADRWSEKVWRDLEAQFPSRKPAKREIEQHGDEPEALAPTRAAAPAQKRRGRSVRRSSWMG